MDRRALITWANGPTSRPLPLLSIDSDRETLIRWLITNDPNGVYTDEDMAREDMDPMTLEQAWEQVEEAYRND